MNLWVSLWYFLDAKFLCYSQVCCSNFFSGGDLSCRSRCSILYIRYREVNWFVLYPVFVITHFFLSTETNVCYYRGRHKIFWNDGRRSTKVGWPHGSKTRDYRSLLSLPNLCGKYGGVSRSLRPYWVGKTSFPCRLLQDDNKMFEMRLLLLLKASCRRGKKVVCFACENGCRCERTGSRCGPQLGEGGWGRSELIQGKKIFLSCNCKQNIIFLSSQQSNHEMWKWGHIQLQQDIIEWNSLKNMALMVLSGVLFAPMYIIKVRCVFQQWGKLPYHLMCFLIFLNQKPTS